jgi:uncharacterized protein
MAEGPRRPASCRTSIPTLDGYVAAIVAGPVSIDPLDWICALLAVDTDAFNHGGTPEFAARTAPQRHQSRSVESVFSIERQIGCRLFGDVSPRRRWSILFGSLRPHFNFIWN